MELIRQMIPPTKNSHAPLPIDQERALNLSFVTMSGPVFLCWKLGRKVLQLEDTVSINDSDIEIAHDGQNVRKVMASEALDSVYVVKCFAEIHEDKQMN